MAHKYNLSIQARRDLETIRLYIGQDNPIAADRVEDEMVQAFRMPAEFPFAGVQRTDLTSKPFRFRAIYSYFIVYDPQVSPLRIIRIVSQHRDIPKML